MSVCVQLKRNCSKYASALERVCEMAVNDKTAFWSQGLKIAANAPLNPYSRADLSRRSVSEGGGALNQEAQRGEIFIDDMGIGG
jgi:hypothetical protein